MVLNSLSSGENTDPQAKTLGIAMGGGAALLNWKMMKYIDKKSTPLVPSLLVGIGAYYIFQLSYKRQERIFSKDRTYDNRGY
jgi:hypothetical protein